MSGPLYIQALPGALTVDVEALVRNNIADVIDALTGDLYDDLAEIADRAATNEAYDGHQRERLLAEQLTELLVERVATRLHLTPQQALRAGRQLTELAAPKALPTAGGEGGEGR